MGRVAIIDDSKDTLDLFGFILKDQHEYESFSDAEAFFVRFRPQMFDLVLLDLVMPVVDGYQVFEWIKDRDQSVPVLAISAKAEAAERERALDAGFCDYFVKPIMEIESFRAAVQKHVGRCANPSIDKTA